MGQVRALLFSPSLGSSVLSLTLSLLSALGQLQGPSPGVGCQPPLPESSAPPGLTLTLWEGGPAQLQELASPPSSSFTAGKAGGPLKYSIPCSSQVHWKKPLPSCSGSIYHKWSPRALHEKVLRKHLAVGPGAQPAQGNPPCLANISVAVTHISDSARKRQ